MGRGPSKAMKRAEAYFVKHPDQTARAIADRFGIDSSTVYNSTWWKEAQKKKQQQEKPA